MAPMTTTARRDGPLPLDKCLLDDREMARGVRDWRRLTDPFPEWDDGDAGLDEARS